MAIKKFTPNASKTKVKPIEFELYDEVFKASGRIQGLALINLMSSASNLTEDSGENDPEKATMMLADIMPFFKSTLLPESYVRFEKMAKDPEKIIEIEDYVEIISYLVESYTNRPTPESGK